MLNILLVSATSFEIEPTLQFLKTFTPSDISVTVKVTGVGMVATAFELGGFKDQPVDLAINAGIAGAFGKFSIGDVVNVTHDCFSELGAEDGDEFLSIDALGFGTQQQRMAHAFENAFAGQFPKASAITVNTTHGNAGTIAKAGSRYSADVESMEGAAFIYAANAFGWKALQLRAISNRVERRNKEAWNIPLAIKSLNAALIGLLKQMADDRAE